MRWCIYSSSVYVVHFPACMCFPLSPISRAMVCYCNLPHGVSCLHLYLCCHARGSRHKSKALYHRRLHFSSGLCIARCSGLTSTLCVISQSVRWETGRYLRTTTYLAYLYLVGISVSGYWRLYTCVYRWCSLFDFQGPLLICV